MIAANTRYVFKWALDFAQTKLTEEQVGKWPSYLQACHVAFPV